MSQTMDTAFRRIGTEARQGTWGPAGPGPFAPASFSATRAYDKLIGLTILALVAGIAGWAIVPSGIAFGAALVAFVAIVISWFKMGWARVLAPVYAVCEGLFLGAISGIYAQMSSGIVPMAVVFTAAVFVGALTLYRTGLVRVTPRMMAFAYMGALGLLAIGVLSLFISLPALAGFGTVGLIFGILCLIVAVTNLFADFDYVQRAEAMGVPAEAEWAAAFAMLAAMVLVYLSILRILASMYGGRRR